VIGLIENTHFDAIEFAEVLTDEIFKTTGTCDNNVNTLTKRVDLRVLANTTEDGCSAKTKTTSERRNSCVDLKCEFTSGRKDERTRAERLTRAMWRSRSGARPSKMRAPSNTEEPSQLAWDRGPMIGGLPSCQSPLNHVHVFEYQATRFLPKAETYAIQPVLRELCQS
jgi:hypothetical protein